MTRTLTQLLDVSTRLKPALFVSLLMAIMLVATGCQSQPFVRGELPALGQTTNQALLDDVARQTPKGVTTDDTVIIQAPFRDDMALLSVAKIDRVHRSLELLGLSPVGMKLFHVAYVDGKPVVRYAAPPLKDQQKVLLSLATDAWHIYFDFIPHEAWTVDRSDTKAIFSEKTDHGTLHYTLAGQPAELIEKSLSTTWRGTRWVVRYYNYTTADTAKPGASLDGRHPSGIVMDNKTYHYRIIIKNRKWQALSP